MTVGTGFWAAGPGLVPGLEGFVIEEFRATATRGWHDMELKHLSRNWG